MLPVSASVIEDKTIIGTATGKMALVMWVPGRNVSILQGEQLGLILVLILSGNASLIDPDAQQQRILTDHLNSVWLIEDTTPKYHKYRDYTTWMDDHTIDGYCPSLRDHQ